MTDPLDGITVVVTRPAAQAGPFIEKLRAAGATVIALPTIVIEPIEVDAALRERLAATHFDWMIFTSGNAVESALRQLGRPKGCRVAAIGRATARALEAQGVAVDALPDNTSDSEGLLALESFSEIGGQRIAILKGEGGRTLLREELARRGADVVPCSLYRRRRATLDGTALAALEGAGRGGRLIVAVTSGEVLGGLLDAAPDDQVPALRDAELLVPGERVAATARSAGWRGRTTLAAGAEDDAMFAALLDRWGRGGPRDAA